ncbi:MAG TPA: dihydrofolate reductase [Chryseolinea sp.]|nr:dihydrofolate reductase [Chryseolinea sp.]
MKIGIYIATSANGMISNSRNVPDWLSAEYGYGFDAICERMKAVIMGRKTYNILDPDYLPLKVGGTIVVLTHDVRTRPANESVMFTNKTPKEIVAMLEAMGHIEAVIIGGALTMSQFINDGLVDDLYIVMEPVIFGNGLRLLTDIELESKLTLLEVTKMNDGTIELHYEMQKSLNATCTFCCSHLSPQQTSAS